jgi:hypothetical protein
LSAFRCSATRNHIMPEGIGLSLLLDKATEMLSEL